jgi:hypothetical protein
MWKQSGSNKWRTLYKGSRSWAKGVPNGSVLSVKIKPVGASEEEEEADDYYYSYY